jgi:hypothetical protein
MHDADGLRRQLQVPPRSGGWRDGQPLSVPKQP